ncbi:MAG TPA: circadian clock KaiB family protein [Terriglobales bacterium]|nr:circadian clock KaiB family protein [Terriglobales bacterium]
MASTGKGKRGSGRKSSAPKIVFGSQGLRQLLSGKPAPFYRLRLYVAGNNLNSFLAIKSLRQLCNEFLPRRVDLEIVDLYQQPHLARRDHVVAAPALIKVAPAPRRIFIGDMTDTRRILSGLGITVAK